MSQCKYPREWLQAWLDGEGGRRSAETRDHLEHCRDCANLVDSWRRSGEELRQTVDAAIGEVEPLVALEKIRARIADAEQRTLGARLRHWWQEMWLFNRRALAGVAVAAALGALVAPGVLYVANRAALDVQDDGLHGPAVVVESLEVGNNATAVVLGGEGGNTTLIWVEPGTDNGYSETF
jgi:anti-sigma factor RsiW